MKNFKNLLLTFIFLPITLSLHATIHFFSQNEVLPEGKFSNVCGDSKLLDFEIEFGYSGSPQVVITMNYIEARFELVDVTGDIINYTVIPDPLFASVEIIVDCPASLSGITTKNLTVRFQGISSTCSFSAYEKDNFRTRLFEDNSMAAFWPGPNPNSKISFGTMFGPSDVFFANVISANNNLLSQQDFYINNVNGTNNYYVEGDFIIDRSYSTSGVADGGREILMNPNSSIIVKSGNTLSLESFEIAPCSDSWNSIIVEDGATLILDKCILVDGTIGVEAQEGASIELVDSYFFYFEEDGQVGVFVNGDQRSFVLENNTFTDCWWGMRAIGAANLEIAPTVPNTFVNCENGIEIALGSGSIINNIFDHCDQSIRLTNNTGFVQVYDNDIGYNNIGVWSIGTMGQIVLNDIGVNPNLGIGNRGIVSSNSSLHAQQNTIFATEQGIRHTFNFSDASKIEHNIVTVTGGGSNNDVGIETWWNQGLLVNDNHVLGNGQAASIRNRNGFGNTISWNTTAASTVTDGICLEGGNNNNIRHNLTSGGETNGIWISDTQSNGIHNNKISAEELGMSFEPNTRDHANSVSCNDFLEGDIDLNVEDRIGLKRYQENEFLHNDSEAITLPGVVSFSRFIFDPVFITTHEPEFDNQDLFRGLSNTSNETPDTPCSDHAGADYNSDPIEIHPPDCWPDDICLLWQELVDDTGVNTKSYWVQLRQLIASYYFECHTFEIPDCIPTTPCWEAQVRAEVELRQAMLSTFTGSDFQDKVTSVQAIANQQLELIYEDGGGIGEAEPCDDIIVITYRETYEYVLKQITGVTLNNSELNILKQTAALCPAEYGEVIYWAQGLLGEYNMTAITQRDCNVIENRERESLNLASHVLKISPNPATDRIIVTWDAETADRLNIMDVMGRTVQDHELDNAKHVDISLMDLPVGLYRINLIRNNSILSSKALVKE